MLRASQSIHLSCRATRLALTRFAATSTRHTASPKVSSHYASTAGTVVILGIAVASTCADNPNNNSNKWSIMTTTTTHLDASRPRVSIGGDIIMAGTPVKEPSTGILFPQICNGLDFAGAGVRVKWGLIKVYAVGTYLDRVAMNAVIKSNDKEVFEKALLDPNYPRTIRIVMARGLSVDKFTSAIIEALEPRMHGEDLEKLEEFKNLMPKVDLIKGAEMLMTIRGDSLLFKNPLGGIGEIRSKTFTTAMCDVYYGADAVSPSHKKAVLEGIKKL